MSGCRGKQEKFQRNSGEKKISLSLCAELERPNEFQSSCLSLSMMPCAYSVQAFVRTACTTIAMFS